ncbi:MAG: p-aminobenzoyl-glutamate transport protein [Pseudomonadales bacterium]|nr:p-aminobenzoyl-glutamate transport protein [Pseudomonadales bacterium]
MAQRDDARTGGVLGWIERTGNRLPDPVFIFLYLIVALIVVSVVASAADYSALHPSQRDAGGAPLLIAASSLLAPENIRRLWADMPHTFTAFHPLGYVLVVMLGAGVAERSGLFAAAMRGAVHAAPAGLLTPMVALVAMMGNLAADAAYVVLVPLAAILYAAAGRHPIAGIAAAFAGVSGAFSANLVPGQLDALLFGITEAAAEALLPAWNANIVGNWYFIVGMTVVFLPVIWYVTDRVIEPRLGRWDGGGGTAGEHEAGPVDASQRRALRHAGLAALAVVLLWTLFLFGPGTPLLDRDAVGPARLSPFFRSLVAGFLVLFLASGWAYGRIAGTVRTHRDIVRMMKESMGELAYYLVLAFAAAHFIAMFAWSNLGLILAVHGAEAIRASGLPAPALLALIVLLTAGVNLFVGSASAKWALLAPVLVPMMMLLGISPEATTAAYRVGDGATNIVTPLMVYFPLVLTFCQRWRADFGIGSLVATMLPFSLALLVAGTFLTIVWIALGVPLGPAAPVHFALP